MMFASLLMMVAAGSGGWVYTTETTPTRSSATASHLSEDSRSWVRFRCLKGTGIETRVYVLYTPVAATGFTTGQVEWQTRLPNGALQDFAVRLRLDEFAGGAYESEDVRQHVNRISAVGRMFIGGGAELVINALDGAGKPITQAYDLREGEKGGMIDGILQMCGSSMAGDPTPANLLAPPVAKWKSETLTRNGAPSVEAYLVSDQRDAVLHVRCRYREQRGLEVGFEPYYFLKEDTAQMAVRLFDEDSMQHTAVRFVFEDAEVQFRDDYSTGIFAYAIWAMKARPAYRFNLNPTTRVIDTFPASTREDAAPVERVFSACHEKLADFHDTAQQAFPRHLAAIPEN